ncbi:hypothetical protein F5B18DRAFT_601550 [Nemania serpens]|nr:hypothetical protein F5B18DRAFT_601550 [Nemania serpens]
MLITRRSQKVQTGPNPQNCRRLVKLLRLLLPFSNNCFHRVLRARRLLPLLHLLLPLHGLVERLLDLVSNRGLLLDEVREFGLQGGQLPRGEFAGVGPGRGCWLYHFGRCIRLFMQSLDQRYIQGQRVISDGGGGGGGGGGPFGALSQSIHRHVYQGSSSI